MARLLGTPMGYDDFTVLVLAPYSISDMQPLSLARAAVKRIEPADAARVLPIRLHHMRSETFCREDAIIARIMYKGVYIDVGIPFKVACRAFEHVIGAGCDMKPREWLDYAKLVASAEGVRLSDVAGELARLINDWIAEKKPQRVNTYRMGALVASLEKLAYIEVVDGVVSETDGRGGYRVEVADPELLKNVVESALGKKRRAKISVSISALRTRKGVTKRGVLHLSGYAVRQGEWYAAALSHSSPVYTVYVTVAGRLQA